MRKDTIQNPKLKNLQTISFFLENKLSPLLTTAEELVGKFSKISLMHPTWENLKEIKAELEKCTSYEFLAMPLAEHIQTVALINNEKFKLAKAEKKLVTELYNKLKAAQKRLNKNYYILFAYYAKCGHTFFKEISESTFSAQQNLAKEPDATTIFNDIIDCFHQAQSLLLDLDPSLPFALVYKQTEIPAIIAELINLKTTLHINQERTNALTLNINMNLLNLLYGSAISFFQKTIDYIENSQSQGLIVAAHQINTLIDQDVKWYLQSVILLQEIYIGLKIQEKLQKDYAAFPAIQQPTYQSLDTIFDAITKNQFKILFRISYIYINFCEHLISNNAGKKEREQYLYLLNNHISDFKTARELYVSRKAELNQPISSDMQHALKESASNALIAIINNLYTSHVLKVKPNEDKKGKDFELLISKLKELQLSYESQCQLNGTYKNEQALANWSTIRKQHSLALIKLIKTIHDNSSLTSENKGYLLRNIFVTLVDFNTSINNYIKSIYWPVAIAKQQVFLNYLKELLYNLQTNYQQLQEIDQLQLAAYQEFIKAVNEYNPNKQELKITYNFIIDQHDKNQKTIDNTKNEIEKVKLFFQEKLKALLDSIHAEQNRLKQHEHATLENLDALKTFLAELEKDKEAKQPKLTKPKPSSSTETIQRALAEYQDEQIEEDVIYEINTSPINKSYHLVVEALPDEKGVVYFIGDQLDKAKALQNSALAILNERKFNTYEQAIMNLKESLAIYEQLQQHYFSTATSDILPNTIYKDYQDLIEACKNSLTDIIPRFEKIKAFLLAERDYYKKRQGANWYKHPPGKQLSKYTQERHALEKVMTPLKELKTQSEHVVQKAIKFRLPPTTTFLTNRAQNILNLKLQSLFGRARKRANSLDADSAETIIKQAEKRNLFGR